MSKPVVATDLRQFVLVGDPQISPDGKHVVFTRRVASEKLGKYETSLWIVPTDGGDPRQLTSGETDGHPRWSPDGNTIAFISKRGDDADPQIYLLPGQGGEALPLTDFPEGGIRDFKWSPDGTRIACVFRAGEPDNTREAKKQREEDGSSDPARVIDEMFYRFDGDGYFNGQRWRLEIVDAKTGDRRDLFGDTMGFFSYDWSPDGKELACCGNRHAEAILNPWEDGLFRIDVENGEVVPVTGLPEGSKTAPKWSPDGKRIAYAGSVGRESWGCTNLMPFVLDVESNELRNLGDGNDYCLLAVTLSDTAEATFDAQLNWLPDNKTLLSNFGTRGERHIWRIDTERADFAPLTSGRTTFQLGNISADGKRLAAARYDAVSLPEIVFFDIAAGELPSCAELTRFNEGYVKEHSIRESQPFSVASASATEVPGWIITPPDFDESKTYPAILEVHGGPHTQYGEAFFHEFQVLANAGYVVAFTNPRGSKGYGEEHCAAIRGNWGEADWEDIQAVIAHLKSLPFVDSKRMAIMGGSYGGYMTNWAIAHTDEFAAAITDRCVSNLVSCGGSSDWPLTDEPYWGGHPWENHEHLWACSPLAHFKNVKTPTLVIHSEGDLRCNVEQGEQVFSALKTLGVPTRLVRYPQSTSHGMSRGGPPDLRIHRLDQILTWFERWL